jgi:hypothetical protein
MEIPFEIKFRVYLLYANIKLSLSYRNLKKRNFILFIEINTDIDMKFSFLHSFFFQFL